MAGTAALITAANAAHARPTPTTTMGIDSPWTNCEAQGKANTASDNPHAAAAMKIARASARMKINTARSVKPSVLRTANSGVRSRVDCIIIVAVANRRATSTALEIAGVGHL